MGQYHRVYNVTKRESFRIGGAKLCEQTHAATAQALLLLLSNSNGRGGGDFNIDSPLVGHWAGDKIVVQGDYAETTDAGYLSPKKLEGFKDISVELMYAIKADCFDDVKAIIDDELDFKTKMAMAKNKMARVSK